MEVTRDNGLLGNKEQKEDENVKTQKLSPLLTKRTERKIELNLTEVENNT